MKSYLRRFFWKLYQRLLRRRTVLEVGEKRKISTIAAAMSVAKERGNKRGCYILLDSGEYKEAGITMEPYVSIIGTNYFKQEINIS